MRGIVTSGSLVSAGCKICLYLCVWRCMAGVRDRRRRQRREKNFPTPPPLIQEVGWSPNTFHLNSWDTTEPMFFHFLNLEVCLETGSFGWHFKSVLSWIVEAWPERVIYKTRVTNSWLVRPHVFVQPKVLKLKKNLKKWPHRVGKMSLRYILTENGWNFELCTRTTVVV